MERKSVHSIESVCDAIKDVVFAKGELNKNGKFRREVYIIFDGDEIKANSQRYQTFLTSGFQCVKCGLKAKYFAKEKAADSQRWHLNLYGVNDDGVEVLFTKDHILPYAKGGKSELSNYQTMCHICNEKKGVNIE